MANPKIVYAHVWPHYVDSPVLNKPGYSISYKTACAPSEDLDELAHLHNLISVFAGHPAGSQKPKLVCNLIGNAVPRLKFALLHHIRFIIWVS